ncbi:hypothetical protein O181_010207 [Austropuccinia psidii MF-1]|uniref:DUF4219 domain-containing protein n=1 Tax=Austropuccinia psidii MF-1 TaxID=1389203 RepID=A0A9Q3BT97_9BASI|nr:hypothetical protein [Austropuccinia psidii MF-1]
MTDKAFKSKDISNIPMLDGTNFGHWHMHIKIHLRSKDLVDMCEKSVPSDSSKTIVNKWARESYEAINLITNRLTERVFCEVLNVETIEKANLLWEKIEDNMLQKGHLTEAKYGWTGKETSMMATCKTTFPYAGK